MSSGGDCTGSRLLVGARVLHSVHVCSLGMLFGCSFWLLVVHFQIVSACVRVQIAVRRIRPRHKATLAAAETRALPPWRGCSMGR